MPTVKITSTFVHEQKQNVSKKELKILLGPSSEERDKIVDKIVNAIEDPKSLRELEWASTVAEDENYNEIFSH